MLRDSQSSAQVARTNRAWLMHVEKLSITTHGTSSWRDAGRCAGKSPSIRNSTLQRRKTIRYKLKLNPMWIFQNVNHLLQFHMYTQKALKSIWALAWTLAQARSCLPLTWSRVCVCKKFENCYHLSIDVIDDHLILVTARTTKNEVSSYSWQKTPRKSSLRRKDCVSDSVVLYKHLTSKNARDFMCHRFEKCSFTKTIDLESQLAPATDSLRI